MHVKFSHILVLFISFVWKSMPCLNAHLTNKNTAKKSLHYVFIFSYIYHQWINDVNNTLIYNNIKIGILGQQSSWWNYKSYLQYHVYATFYIDICECSVECNLKWIWNFPHKSSLTRARLCKQNIAMYIQ